MSSENLVRYDPYIVYMDHIFTITSFQCYVLIAL